jgi:cytochrome c biogenesis protein CcmG, thiol:disulfide interchange protein DsbE
VWIRRLTAAAGLVLLAACTSPAAEGEPTISTAAQAPTSEFTVACPTFSDPVTTPGQDNLPAVSLECLGSEGDPVGLSGQPQRPTVINIWASWCGPCLDEMPLLDQLAQQGAGQVDVLGIVTNDNRSAATSYAMEMGLSFPSVLDPKGQVVDAEGFPGVPASILLDADGTIAFRHIGPYKTLDDLKKDVAEHLGVNL